MKLNMNSKKLTFIVIITLCGLGLSHATSPQILSVINSTKNYTVTISEINVFYGSNPNSDKQSPDEFKNIKPGSQKVSHAWTLGWISWLGSLISQAQPLKFTVTLSKDDKKVYSKEIKIPFDVVNQAGKLQIFNDVNLDYAASNSRRGVGKYTYADWTLTFTENAQK